MCVFEDCHAGQHKKCRMGSSTVDRVLLFCSCPCHRKKSLKKESRGNAERP